MGGSHDSRADAHGPLGRCHLREEGLTVTLSATQLGRGLLLALLAWWTLGLVTHPLDPSRSIDSFLHLINLPFHEAGHWIWGMLGEFMRVFGGSLMQVLIPVVCAVAFVQREDLFAAGIAIWWAGENLIDLGPYIADARALQLPLLGGATGQEVYGHDWEWLLQTLGWLRYDRSLGLFAHWTGSLIMLGALAACAWLLVTEPTPAFAAD